MKQNKNIFVIPLLITFGLCLYFCNTQKFFSFISYPFLKLYSHIEGIEYGSKQKLYNELHELRQEKNKLLSQNIELSAQLAFMCDTESLRQFSRRYEDRVVATAQVLVCHSSDQEQFILVDAGQNCNVKKDMIVVYYNQLVGLVTDVFLFYSKVRLITDRQSSVGGYCFESGEHAVVQGNNSDDLSLLYVSHTKNIRVGDIVYTNGKNSLFIRGFALGKIIEAQARDLYYESRLVPLISFQDMQYCTILQT